MILELTEHEQITLLGILEDLSQAEDINVVFPAQSRIAIKSIMQKLGGTYFGKISFTLDEVTTIVHCEKEEKLKDICQKFAKEINKNINSLLFLCCNSNFITRFSIVGIYFCYSFPDVFSMCLIYHISFIKFKTFKK